MKTVKRMIEELSKFPPDAKCFAYEGEVSGLTVEYKGKYGFIYCGNPLEFDKKDKKTETLEK